MSSLFQAISTMNINDWVCGFLVLVWLKTWSEDVK